MIDGVKFKELKIISDARGQVMHMLRCDDELFNRFGEIYFSVTNPGIIKAWKKHHLVTQLFAVPRGSIQLVIYDDRPDSPSQGKVQEMVLGEDDYKLVRIPCGLWYGFRCLGKIPAMIANCADMPHDPKEVQLIALDDARIPYRWDQD